MLVSLTLRTALAGATTLALAGAAFAQETHPETGEPLAADQSFVYRELDQPASIDPQLIEGVPGSHVARQLFEGLMSQDDQGELVPGVATGFEGNEGNTEFTFTLRDDAKWSNGDPVTAQDFVYAWRRAADPATASEYAWFVELAAIENAAEIIAGEADPDTLGVEAVEDRTLKVTLAEPTPYFPEMTTHTTLFPTHQATIEEHGNDWTDPANLRRQRRLHADRAGAQRVHPAREVRQLLGRRERHPRRGDLRHHQRRQPGADPLPRGRGRSCRARAARALPRAQGRASRRGHGRPAAVLLPLLDQPDRERPRGAQGSARAHRALAGHRPRRDRRSDPPGRPEPRLLLRPPRDGGLRRRPTSPTPT